MSVTLTQPPPRLEAICFGDRGTLFDWSAGLLAAMQPILEDHELRVERAEIERAFVRAEAAVFADADCRTLPWPEAMRRIYAGMAADLGVPVLDREIDDLRHSVRRWPVQLDARDVLPKLGARFRLVVASNLASRVMTDMLAGFDVDFDLVVCADDVGAYKPAAKIFERVLGEFPGDPQQLLCVSTSALFDLRPAASLGLRTARLSRPGLHPDLEAIELGPVLADLHALERWLDPCEAVQRCAGGSRGY